MGGPRQRYGFRVRAVAVVCVTALVVLSGCAGLSDGGATPAATAEETVGPTGTTPSSTANPDSGSTTAAGSRLAPGLTADGLADPLELVNAHTAVLRSEPFTVRYERRQSGDGYDVTQTLSSRTDLNGTVRARAAMRVNTTGSAPSVYENRSGRTAIWRDGGTVFHRAVENDSATYDRIRAMNASISPNLLTQRRDLAEYLSNVENQAVTEVNRDGGTYYRVEGSFQEPYRNGPTNVTAYVAPNGLVAELVVEEAGGERVGPSVLRVTYDDLGETAVERPEWVETAEAATGGTG
ncbi:hypothetical protein C475_11084 [Halosimplex carlsbadense 2-9-1]|uniref:Lipoprotein n=1 Tax=Halosimplex carlsbadense 2-9-1 TaxID=797114 RepID=M0CPD2_9EURY|nr:hypothetical protein [Halosimplex carlsbadense]ELZ25086.1 hypothetical protein C475_11084 [Halosimplex carlsbadense 2-9-1]